MELLTYLAIVRQRWRLAIAPALLAACLSLGFALVEPPRYRASASMLITRSEDRRFDTEDALAYDLPAIVQGVPFSVEVSAALARGGVDVAPERVRMALGASNQRRVVTLWAETGDAAQAQAIVVAALDVVQARGLALWGDPSAAPGRTFVNVVVLEPPGQAARANGPRAVAMAMTLRALAGLLAGTLLVFGVYYRETTRAEAAA